jgi:hypothetical protein
LSPATDSAAGISSAKLQHTAIVPTLDTPMPAGKNVIWCSSFQMAWNHLKDDVIKEPIKLAVSQPVADRLNTAKESETDMTAGSYYAAAGWVEDGIIAKIQQEMKKQFPDVPTPKFDIPLLAAVAYAYLAADIRFDPPFIDNPKKMTFTASDGTSQATKSFGIPPGSYGGRRLKEGVQVLYALAGKTQDSHEFAVDPAKDSQPNQIVLARVAPKATLAETLADVESKIANWKPPSDYPSGYYPLETLLIPNAAYRIDHHFTELEGEDKAFLNTSGQGLWIAEAFQMIDFKINREGAVLKSEAKIAAPASARPERMLTDFVFDRPFLIFIKKRGAERPFFVMWVDNPELLTKW